MDTLLFHPKPQSKVCMPNTMYYSDTIEAFTDV